MTQEHILTIDVGTQSTRAAVVNVAGDIQGIAQIPHETDSPHLGWAQQRPQQWWGEACEAIRQVLGETKTTSRTVAAVAACGQMHGPVGIDKSGEITTPWVQLWCDKRCAAQVEAIRMVHDETQLMKQAANPLNPAWPGIKIRWEKENHTEAYQRTKYYLVPKDFINYRLTGVAAADHSEASCTYVYDCTTGAYSDELAAAVGVDIEKFAPLHKSHDKIGSVTSEAAALTGLAVGTPVVCGGGDFPVSMLGFGIVGDDVVADVTGTSSLLAAHSPQPLIDPAIQNCRHAVDGWVPFTILDCGGVSMKWCRELINSIGEEKTYEDLIELARKAPAGSDGLVFFPYMRGERRCENVNSRGGWFGVRLEHTAMHFIRSVMEGVALAIGRDMGIFRERGLKAGKIMNVGGGTRNELWNEIKAGVLGLPLEVSPEPEAGIKGCALLGAAGAGLIGNLVDEAKRRRASSRDVLPVDMPQYALAQKEFNRIYEHMLGFWSAPQRRG
jgi:xylulokinase